MNPPPSVRKNMFRTSDDKSLLRSAGKRCASNSLIQTPPNDRSYFETPPTRRLNFMENEADGPTPSKLARGEGGWVTELDTSFSPIQPTKFDSPRDFELEDCVTPNLSQSGIAGGELDSPSWMHCTEVEDGMVVDTPPTPERCLRRTDSLGDTKILGPSLHRTQSTFRFEHHFEMIAPIGKGSFSTVYRVKHSQNGKLYAVKKSKKMFRGRNDRRQYVREIENVARLPDHPNIVKYYRAWQFEQYFFVQMELCDGGTLRCIAKHGPVPMLQLCHYMRDVLSGLEVIHRYQLVHLDLKPDNILWNTMENRLKIADFGLAVAVEEWSDQEGDKIYLAREVLDEVISSACDIFSCGLLFWEIMTFQSPPKGGEDWINLRVTGTLPFPPHLNLDPSICQLLLSMISPMHELRPSAGECLTNPTLLAAASQPRGFWPPPFTSQSSQ